MTTKKPSKFVPPIPNQATFIKHAKKLFGQSAEVSQIHPKKPKFQRDLADFEATDYDDRNIMHRACLDQQPKVIQDILTEIQSRNIDEIVGKDQSNWLGNYINSKDKFQCAPIILCCVSNRLSNDGKYSTRYECLKLLLENQAKGQTCNSRTLWTPLHWSCYYGDEESVKLLLMGDERCHVFLPDYKGQYPVDLAGKGNYINLAIQLIEISVRTVIQYNQFKEGKLLKDDQNYVYIQSLEKHDKHLRNPLFTCKLLFWAGTFKVKKSLIQDIIRMERTYFFAPFTLEKNRNAIHAACTSGNIEFIQFCMKQYRERTLNKQLSLIPPKITQNTVYSFTPEELEMYRPEFQQEVMNFAKWEVTLLQPRRKSQKVSPEDELNVHIDHQDLFGNSALHMASLKGYGEIVKLLLDSKANMELENKELFKAKELTQHKEVQLIYKDKFINLEKLETLMSINLELMKQMSSLFTKKQYEEISIIRNMREKIYDPIYKQKLQKLNLYSNQLFVPDFVIRASLTELDVASLQTSPFSFDLKKVPNLEKLENNAGLQRLNFQISLLQNAKFEVFLMKSYYEDGFYYIMLQHEESQLEKQAQQMALQVKLMDSYDLEEFQIQFQDLFEPFRSRQRQQIIEHHLRRIINLNELIRAKIITSSYRMHKAGGLNKIKETWIDSGKWYWRQPLNQMKDYLSEGQGQNFTSITVLRLYFGEKISFYFAWKSYITCATMALAIPGVVLQLYIIATDNYFPQILPFWVCYVCLWSTLQVEFWKRKTSEITTRWGCLDLIEQKEDKVMRMGFSGYEEIYQVTGSLTKHQKKSETLLKYCLSIIVLGCFIALCVFIFVGIDYLIVNYSQQNNIIIIILGLIQGVGISLLNYFYPIVAKYFADFENHKFEMDYESSMIYKNSAFKFLNSYLSIFYAAFYKDVSTLSSLFLLLLPVLVQKQATYVVLQVFVPQRKYEYAEQKYFQKQKLIIKRQQQIRDMEDQSTFKDAIELIYNLIFVNSSSKRTVQSSKRAVLKIAGAKNNIQIESNIDCDAVELNNLKQDFEGTLNYFMEGMIDLGYITLFTAAFPIGPAIAVLANIVEINMKIISFMEVYKRTATERCAGIGEWLYIMEWMGVLSVFTNFMLLYVKQKKETIVAIYNYSGDDNDVIIWLYFLTIAVILVLKIFFQWIIPDTPQWVLNEMERMGEKQHVNTGQMEALGKAKGELITKSELFDRVKQSKNEILGRYDQELQNQRDCIQRVSDQIERFKKQQELERNLQLNDQEILKQLGTINITSDNYKQVQLGLLKQTYIQIEYQLLMKRLKQIDIGKIADSFICQNCLQKEAVFDCQVCDENYCQTCYFANHQNVVHELILLKNLKFYDPLVVNSLNFKKKNTAKQIKDKNKMDLQVKIDDKTKMNRWKKIQQFAYPILKQSSQYNILPTIYKLFEQEYIELLKNNIIKMSSIYRFSKKGDTFINYESETIQQIVTLGSLNIEEKIWLNRIAFLVFKKNQNFDQFYTYCKLIQDGNLFQKVKLLVDMADIDESGYIDKNEMEQMFTISLVQDSEQKFKLQDILNGMFNQQQYDKATAYKLILESLKQEDFKQFLESLVQCN